MVSEEGFEQGNRFILSSNVWMSQEARANNSRGEITWVIVQRPAATLIQACPCMYGQRGEFFVECFESTSASHKSHGQCGPAALPVPGDTEHVAAMFAITWAEQWRVFSGRPSSSSR